MLNLQRIFVIASNGFREVIRDRILYFIIFFAVILGLALQLLPEISANNQNKMFLDFGIGIIGLMSAIISIFIGTNLVNKEIEKRTVLVLIPKPISRAEFIIGKHLGLSGVVAILLLIMGLIYFGLMAWAKISFPVFPLFICLLYLFLELMLLIAVAIVFSVFTSSVLAFVMSSGIYLMGNISRDILELTKISKSESIATLTQTLYLILPDLSRLDFKNTAVYGLLPSNLELLNNGLYGIFYTLVLLAIAIVLFTRKEF